MPLPLLETQIATWLPPLLSSGHCSKNVISSSRPFLILIFHIATLFAKHSLSLFPAHRTCHCLTRYLYVFVCL